MIVVPEGDASGLFDVYSANDDKNEIYTVDLNAETCECGDYEHRQPAGGCKHIRRVKLGLGIMPLPAGIELDGCLVDTREKYGVDVDPNGLVDAHTPDSTAEEAGASAITTVATDGGQPVAVADLEMSIDGPEITGPHMEPPEVSNATTFWRCEGCGRESIHETDTERPAFHAEGCLGGGGL
jgi:hypothetical protein